MQLPFEDGVEWSFSGGPHGGWGNGAAWAALDFAPPGDLDCVPNDEWVVAMADGLIVRAEDGSVVQDLDGDGNEHTGWTILYLHISSWTLCFLLDGTIFCFVSKEEADQASRRT